MPSQPVSGGGAAYIPNAAQASPMAGALQNYIVAQFNGTTYAPNSLDVQHEPLYDVQWNSATNAPWAAGATIPGGGVAQFFVTGNQSGKTLGDTNVNTGRKLDAPEAFAVMGIGLHAAENILLADMLTIYNTFDLEFWIGNKWYNRGPVWFYPAGGGIAGFSQQSNAVALTNGVTGKFNRHTLAINIIIDNQASFFGQFNGNQVVLTAAGSGGTGANLKMVLDGLHARGVQ